METKRRTAASILLLMLSLQLAAAMAVAAAADGLDVIRLPTGAKGAADGAAGGDGGKKKPYDCCDQQICLHVLPPKCVCADRVESCSSGCGECEGVAQDRYVCHDWYQYEMDEKDVPRCHPY